MFYLLKWKSDLKIGDIVQVLKERAMLPSTMVCPNCKNEMVIHKDNSRKDHYRWVCKRCRKRRPIRINTWASKYRIPFTELYLLVRYYTEELPVMTAAERLNLDFQTVEDFYTDLDELQPIFCRKLRNIIDREIPNQATKAKFKASKSFRELSKIFVLSLVFSVVHETINEMWSEY